MKKLRAAIYTRKSSEEGLDQSFNSLDAQREACSAYITSQKSEGWIGTRTRYDDGGWSGGNMDRPGLRLLLEDIEAGRIDIVVVYKVDRLSRSLADFARIVELFDRKGVSFVSVTQAFNTTTSMGRLTLNVLLSFAQFEREVTGERIRDKLAASKAKGMWMGGSPPLGYEPHDRTLLINESEAEIVRHIFRRYLELGSVHMLARELERDGYRTKVVTSKSGVSRGGVPFSRGPLFYMLGNRIYLGEIVHKDAVYPGLHPAIVDRELFDRVQARLGRTREKRRVRRHLKALLSGRLFDALGNRMTMTHGCGRGGQRYRYYISSARASAPAPDHLLSRVPADSIEEIVTERLRQWSARKTAGWSDLGEFVARVEVYRDAIILDVRPPGHERWHIDKPDKCSPQEDGSLRITSPVHVQLRGGRTWRIEGAARPQRTRPDRALIAGLRRAHAELRTRGIHLANSEAGMPDPRAVDDPYLRKLTRLAFLAPDIQRSILEGRQPSGLRLADLLYPPLPLSWDEQRHRLGFAEGT